MTVDTATVLQATVEPSNDIGLTGYGREPGTIPVVLLTEACINITSMRLPLVFQ